MAYRFDVFISYATADRDVVAPFAERLEQDGFKVWFDVEQMAGGLSVVGQLSDGIDESAHTIACLSDAYIERDFTAFELKSSVHLDPSGKSARTIPVKFRPLTREVPNYIRQLTICDLTVPSNYDQEYNRITSMVRKLVTREPPTLDRETVKQACDAPFQNVGEPYVALFRIRGAAKAISKFLYSRYIGDLPADPTVDLLIEKLIVSGKLPQHINSLLATVQTYGRIVVGDRIDDDFVITPESIAPALQALTALRDWTFGGPSLDPWAEIWNGLPTGGDPAERQIPGTNYFLREPRISRNSLGPLFHGRDASRNEPVSVNLVTLPEDRDSAFFAEVSRFAQLRNVNIVSPLDAGRIVVDGRRRCLYVIMPPVDGVSAKDLTEHVGALPVRAAYELCLGIASALEGFHAAFPPIVHGDIKPANVLVGRFGTVRVLCIGRELAATPADACAGGADNRIDSVLFASPEQRSGMELTPKTDLSALHTVLYYLLSGDYPSRRPATSATLSAAVGSSAFTLERLKLCGTAEQARRILEDACRRLPATPSLATVNRRYHEEKHPHPKQVPPPFSPGTVGQFGLVAVCPIESRRAWPLGDGQLLVWEMGTDTLAILVVLDGSDLVWRDTRQVAVRQVVTAADSRLAVGGWDGAVRYFAEGSLATALELDGTVGDLRFTRNGLIAGSWKGALWYTTADGRHEELLGIDRGVHRIAVADNRDQFAVADLSGRFAVYANHVRIRDVPVLDNVCDIAYAASRLVILTDDRLTSMSLDFSLSPYEDKPGAVRLLPGPTAGHCLLLVEAARDRELVPALEAWLIDEADRHVPYAAFPAGHTLISACGAEKRFTLAVPGSGCAYWRDNTEQQVWPDALAATISADGRLIAVSRPGRVELYEDPL